VPIADDRDPFSGSAGNYEPAAARMRRLRMKKRKSVSFMAD